MSKSIAIIDPDIHFSRLLSQRLKHHLPDANITTFSPDDLNLAGRTWDEDAILFDNLRTDPDKLRQCSSASFLPMLIPLRTESSDGGCRIPGNTLTHKLLYSTGLSTENAIDSSSVLAQRDSGRLRIFFSLGDRTKRENYIRSNTAGLISAGHRLIRLDLMPGVSISRPRFNVRGRNLSSPEVSSGISDLLLLLESGKVDPDVLLEYLHPDSNGWLHFGRPIRSDDIIQTDSSVLVSLVRMLRDLVDTSSEKTSAAVVLEGIPFSKARHLCPLAHELHVILPEDDSSEDHLIGYELQELFASLSPKQLKFLSSNAKVAI
jgi:hypothetical protein